MFIICIDFIAGLLQFFDSISKIAGYVKSEENNVYNEGRNEETKDNNRA